MHVASLTRLPVTGRLTFESVLSTLVVVLLLVSSMGGLLYGGRGLYEPDLNVLPQLYGQDAITLILVLPLLLGSMWMAHRGSMRALPVWAGPLLYVAYTYSLYVAGVRFGPLFLVPCHAGVCLMLTLLATTVLVMTWGRPVDPIHVGRPSP
jgi:hypothetical protein